MNRMLFAGLGVTGVIAVAAALMFPPAPPSSTKAEVQAPPPARTSTQVAMRPSTTVMPAATKRSISADILASLTSSKNLKAFVEEARQHPEKGGYAYANTATLYCHSVLQHARQSQQRKAQIAASNTPDVNRRLAAMDELARLCQGFAPDESGISLLEEGLQRGDVVLMAKKKLADAREEPFEKKVRLAREMAALGDYQVVQELMNFAAVPEGKDNQPVVYLDGKRYGGASGEVFNIAINVMLCSFGMDCTTSANPALLEACGLFNRCFPDYLALLQSDFKSRPEQWDQVTQLAARLSSIVDSGEFQAFAPP